MMVFCLCITVLAHAFSALSVILPALVVVSRHRQYRGELPNTIKHISSIF